MRYHSKEYQIPFLFGAVLFNLLLEQRNPYKWKLFLDFSLFGREVFHFETSVEDGDEDTYLGYINHHEVDSNHVTITKHL